MWISRDEQREWESGVAVKVKAFAKEIEKEYPDWVMKRRKEYLTGILDKAKSKLSLWKLSCGRLALKEKKESVRYWLLRFVNMSPFEKEITKIKKQIDWLDNRNKIKSGKVTQDMIDKAKAYPIENILDPEIVRKGKMICPWHNDTKPSLVIHRGKGYAYCFVCQKSMNAINYLRMTNNLSFVDAVKALQ